MRNGKEFALSLNVDDEFVALFVYAWDCQQYPRAEKLLKLWRYRLLMRC